jgi:hypothetical protein
MSKISGNKSGRKFSKESVTYKMFEELFLNLNEEKIPCTLPMPKGQAINLAMGMNRCHVQWAQENGIPEEFMTRSAKAIAGETDATWMLEISLNQRRTRRHSRASWMQDLLTSLQSGEASPLTDGGVGLGAELDRSVGNESNAPEADTEWIDPQDDLLASYLKGEK